MKKIAFIDERLESYRTFFDPKWAERIMDLAADSKLTEAVFSLCVNWKAVANTHIVPWFTVNSASHFAKGFMEAHDPLGVKKIIDVLAHRLPAEMGKPMTNMQRKRFDEAIRRIGTDVDNAMDIAKDQDESNPESFWKELLSAEGSSEFRLIIWGSQRICYGAIYHAYEDFVRQCIVLAFGNPEFDAGYRIKNLRKNAKQFFGESLAKECLNSKEVNVARLVRNALAHNGGRENDELKEQKHGILVEDGELQIMAPDTRSLFDVLKQKSYRLAENAVTLPGMKQPVMK